MSKITIIGAGNVGATCADVIVRRELASEVVLLDIKEGFAEGKALDITQTASLNEFDTRVTGTTNDYSKTKGSDVVIITSGIPRKPGMTREELIGTNAGIVKDLIGKVLAQSPEAVLIIVSNPMDTMTYLTVKSAGISKNRIIGMGGMLDSARFKCYLSKALDVPASDIEGTVIGGHGDTTMIPLKRLASYKGIPVASVLDSAGLDKVASDTMVGGATLTKLLGTSAWYAPGAAAATLAEAVIRDQKKLLPCSVYLDGEYGQKDICIGVPVVIGKNGWEKIVELDLNEEEKALFSKSADAVRATNQVLYETHML